MSGVAIPVAFGRALRRAGIRAPSGSIITFARALDAVGLDQRARVHAAARATLLHRPEDRARFDACFAAFFDGVAGATGVDAEEPPPAALAVDDVADGPDTGEDDDEPGPMLQLRFSAAEVLRHKDFGTCTPAELDELHRAMHHLRLEGAQRRSRRARAARRGRPDVRRTVRRALATGGEPLVLAQRGPSSRPRRVVLLLDVSGSMEPYARALLRFAHAAVVARGRVEVFTLGTRLTRLTRELATHDPDIALRRAGEAMPDWAGGTRLGEALRAFNDRWGVRGMARGAVVILLSDGWDRGDPALLGAEVARLRRVAFRVVWANPLKATPGYAPLAAGMAAALPHVDAFVEGHALSSMEQLARIVAQP
jgi:uncharacterized protein with von Willebrand factor type A (vWA) domain